MKKIILTDIHHKSLMDYGTKEFPFAYYYDEISRYHENSINWHWHNDIELSYVILGPIYCSVGEKEIILETGDMCFINQNAIHRFVSHSGGLMLNCIFSPEFLAPIGSKIYTEYVVPILSSGIQAEKIDHETVDGMNMIQEINLIHNELKNQSFTWELQVQSSILKIWRLLFRMVRNHINQNPASDNMRNNRTNTRLLTMLSYIHDNYQEKINLESIAASTNISKSEAMRCFKEGLDMTPNVYLTQYRLSRAKDLLQKRENSVQTIAMECGFDNSSYFCKVFKKNENMTPLEFCEKYGI